MPGIPWQSGVALAFNIGADTVMAEWEASLIREPGTVVDRKVMSPEEAWDLL